MIFKFTSIFLIILLVLLLPLLLVLLLLLLQISIQEVSLAKKLTPREIELSAVNTSQEDPLPQRQKSKISDIDIDNDLAPTYKGPSINTHNGKTSRSFPNLNLMLA